MSRTVKVVLTWAQADAIVAQFDRLAVRAEDNNGFYMRLADKVRAAMGNA